MYKAIQEIGGYKIGDEVPTDKAETWLKMYDVPPVEKVDGDSKESEPEEKSSKTTSVGTDVMLDDYLSRNTNVVRKNIEEDDLSQKQLESLLELEKSDKKRRVVMKAIRKELNKLEG